MFEKIYDFTDFLWGIPLTILVIATGLYLSIRTGFFQITGIKTWWKLTVGEVFSKRRDQKAGEGELTPWQAITTVLGGTVGSGNIAGVAAAIAVGGPGAIFWMWLIAIVGMLTKMTEVSLSVKYRKQIDGEYYGGPMHYMKAALGTFGKVLAAIYGVALFLDIATDACAIQVTTLAEAVNQVFGVNTMIIAAIVVVISLIVILSGGVKKVGKISSMIVPPMVIIYFIGCMGVIIANIGNLPAALGSIFRYAFAPAPAIGGFAGATVTAAISKGAARGIFSNEAGMGTAATVHATAQTDHPIHQGMYGIFEIFVDTIIVCSLTGLA
ncbi:MAG: sodium:alanine symporter family protein, partial [Clostridia bacterium]|nr:sodium:alanine symporter family protein [Clostridia bacterium]